MTQINLPKLNQTGKNEWGDVEDNDVAIAEVVNGGLDNDNLSGEAGITAANLAASAKPITWYTPKAIATEQSRESATFGTLTTADQIAEVVVPEGGQLFVFYSALFKSSVSAAGRAALFIGSNQAKQPQSSGEPTVQEASTSGTAFASLSSGLGGLTVSGGTSFVTTGEFGSTASGTGGMSIIRRLAAGTYTVSIQFKATSGSVTAKERVLAVAVLGA